MWCPRQAAATSTSATRHLSKMPVPRFLARYVKCHRFDYEDSTVSAFLKVFLRLSMICKCLLNAGWMII